jgi:tripartite ATP-independent transporter DctM subunit
VLGTIFFGVATPTEASGIGALGAMLLAWANGRLDFTSLRETCQQTTKTTAFIFAIMIGATAYSLVLRGLGGDELIEQLLRSLGLGPHGVLISVLAFIFVLGFFLDWIEITLVVLPLVTPVMTGFGFDPIWFIVLVAIVLQTSFLTPPVGFSLFYLKGVAPPSVSTMQIYRGILPFVALILVCLAIAYVWQDLVLWLPSVAYSQ